MPAGRSSVVGGSEIPYQPWAATKKAENFQNRAQADPLSKCYMPGVPRSCIWIFRFRSSRRRSAIAMTFAWSLDYRLIQTDGTPHPQIWMRGWAIRAAAGMETPWLWTSRDNNDKTWLDMAGDFHSDALHVVERYRLTDARHDSV